MILMRRISLRYLLSSSLRDLSPARFLPTSDLSQALDRNVPDINTSRQLTSAKEWRRRRLSRMAVTSFSVISQLTRSSDRRRSLTALQKEGRAIQVIPLPFYSCSMFLEFLMFKITNLFYKQRIKLKKFFFHKSHNY